MASKLSDKYKRAKYLEQHPIRPVCRHVGHVLVPGWRSRFFQELSGIILRSQKIVQAQRHVRSCCQYGTLQGNHVTDAQWIAWWSRIEFGFLFSNQPERRDIAWNKCQVEGSPWLTADQLRWCSAIGSMHSSNRVPRTPSSNARCHCWPEISSMRSMCCNCPESTYDGYQCRSTERRISASLLIWRYPHSMTGGP